MLTIFFLLVSVLLIILATTRLNLHPFLALLAACLLFGLGTGMAPLRLVGIINEGFGSTIGSIGIIIIAGLIIGTFLERSGGALTLARFFLRLIGPGRVHTAMGTIGYIVSIPVFADSGFIILSPLNRALSQKAALSLAGTALALSLGLMASHTMVPPTPGPIAAAGIIGADLGVVILIGLITSIGSLAVAITFCSWMGKRIWIDPALEGTERERQKEQAPGRSPSTWHAFLPIVIPILLIVARSVADYPTQPLGSGTFVSAVRFLGNPVIALLIGVLIGFTLPQKLDRKMLGTSGWIGEALTNAAIIILITGAGGAFGKVLQASDLSKLLEAYLSGPGLGIFLPFLVAAALKTAQGSSTVAIITTASIVGPLLPVMGLDGEVSRALVVIAIGAGSAVISHANDSFFWVVTQLSGMNVQQGYRLQSLGSGLLGVTAMGMLFVMGLFL